MDYQLFMREGRTCADLATPKPHLTPSQAAAQVISNRDTDLISTSHTEFARQLINQGSTVKRNSIAMTCNLTNQEITPRTIPNQTRFIEEVEPENLFISWNNAHGEDHPDHVTGEKQALIDEHLKPLLDHSEVGPNHRSSIAVLENGTVIAAIIVSLREGQPTMGGPWISEIWVDPDHQGKRIARYLIDQAQLTRQQDGFTSLGLAVTNGNPAKNLYATAGFTTVEEFWTLILPTV